VSAIPEIVEEGANGRLVPPEDSAALAAALEALVRDPAGRQRLGAHGIRQVADGWDVEAGVDRLTALLYPAQERRLQLDTDSRESPARAARWP